MDDYIIEETITKPTGEKQIKQYKKGPLLGKGSETECFELTSLDMQKSFAVKLIHKAKFKTSRLKQRLKTEVRIQSKLNHTNIVKFERIFEDSESIYVLFELCSNKTLNELLQRRKRLTESEAQCYLSKLIAAVKYMHSLKVIHRDLRLNNLFLSEKMELKVGDFAYATRVEFEGEKKKSVCGTPNYMAPEVIDGSHSYEADIWSLGVILYTILIGRPPFRSENSKQTYEKIKSAAFNYPESSAISDSARDLINSILTVDPAARPSLDQILSSDFMQGPIPKLMPISTLVSPPSEGRRPSVPKRSEKLTQEQFRANVKMTGNIFTGVGADGEIFVKKWIDYTWKYGLGYLLSNGNCGVCFVDGTRMILNSMTSQVFYMEKGSISEHNLNEIGEELKKKSSLLQYFKAFLENETETSIGDNDTKLPVYLKKWMITRHALIFRLSSRSVQVNFLDHSELTLNCDLRMVTFANRKGEKIKLPLAKALQSNNPEILRRLKYTRDAIKHMIKYKL